MELVQFIEPVELIEFTELCENKLYIHVLVESSWKILPISLHRLFMELLILKRNMFTKISGFILIKCCLQVFVVRMSPSGPSGSIFGAKQTHHPS